MFCNFETKKLQKNVFFYPQFYIFIIIWVLLFNNP